MFSCKDYIFFRYKNEYLIVLIYKYYYLKNKTNYILLKIICNGVDVFQNLSKIAKVRIPVEN